jgi:hypothetical protein
MRPAMLATSAARGTRTCHPKRSASRSYEPCGDAEGIRARTFGCVRRLATMLAVLAVVGIAVAALINTLASSSPSKRDEAAEGSVPQAGVTESMLSECRTDQLALAFDSLGDDDAVALRHVKGEPCRLPRLALSVTVVDRAGRLSALPLAEAEFSGDFSPGFEKIVRFSGCRGEGLRVATATAGPYSATSRIRAGGRPCIDAVQRRIVRLERGRDSGAVYLQALDPATHSFTVRVTVPRSAKIRVVLETATGLRIRVLDAARRHDFCHQRRVSDVCVVPFAVLETERPGGWTVWVRKFSAAPTRIPLSIAFDPID